MHDSAFNSGAGGLLPVCKSTSYSLEVCSQGPTGPGRGSKVRISGSAEDFLPVSEVEAGVNFRPAGNERGQVAVFTSWKATRHRYQAGQGKCGHTFPPPGGVLVSNSSTDWTSGNLKVLDEGV